MTDWGNLYTQGRCKAIGVPWNDEEKHAVFVLRIPADYVRLGCLTVEAWKAMEAGEKEEVARTGKKQLVHLRKEQLYKICLAQGINVTPEASKSTLLEELKSRDFPSSIPVEKIPD